MPNQPTQTGRNTSADTQVRQLLRDAFHTQEPATPGFRAAVWERISAATRPLTWPQWLRGHLIGVSAATAACALLAALAGGWIAQEQNRSQRQQHISNYVSSIDAHRHLAAQGITDLPDRRSIP